MNIDHQKFMHMHGQGGSPMKKETFTIVLKDKTEIARDTVAFIFEKPEGFKFRAGQHVLMTLLNPPETDAEGDSRFFSIASTPQDPNLVFAMRIRDTAFKRVLGHLPVGGKVMIQILTGVPHGAFALHDDLSKPAVFIAGGIGIVPVYSMIKDATERKLSQKLILFYANRRPEDVSFLSDLQQLAAKNKNFTLIATITEPEKSIQGWQGETGAINESIIKKYVTDLYNPIYYVAGLPEMTEALKKLLVGFSVKEENIKSEVFSGFDSPQTISPNHMDHEGSGIRKHPRKRYVLFVLIALAVLAMAAIHLIFAHSLYDHGLLSFKNPLVYILIVLTVVIIGLKLKFITRHGKPWRK